MKKLIIAAHPDLNNSVFNVKILQKLTTQPDVRVVDLYQQYPDRKINIDVEAANILASDIIVFQFPLYWYSAPSLLKDYQDQVLSMKFAVGPQNIAKLKGKRFLISTTAGTKIDNYLSFGRIGIPVTDLLMPYRACAKYFDMHYLDPVISYRCHPIAGELTPAIIDEIIATHVQRVMAYF